MPEAVQELLNISLKVLYFRLFERNSCDIVSCSLLSQLPTLRYYVIVWQIETVVVSIALVYKDTGHDPPIHFTRHLGIDCVCDEQLEMLCQGILQLETLDLSGSFVTDNRYDCMQTLPT